MKKTKLFLILILLFFSINQVFSQVYERLPIPNTLEGYDLWTGYAEPKILGSYGSMPTNFHEAIDIVLETDEKVYPARRGTVKDYNVLKQWVAIESEDGEFDIYGHVVPSDDVATGVFFNTNQSIGISGNANHIHFVRLKSWKNHYYEEYGIPGYSLGATNSLNPLKNFPVEYQDWGNGSDALPHLTDEYSDKVEFKKQSNGSSLNANHLYGKVDIIAAAIDNLFIEPVNGFDTDRGIALYSLGYWIENISGNGDNVRSATNPYLLFEMKDEWFDDWDCQSQGQSDELEAAILYCTNINEPHYYVTNTTGTSGAANDVDGEQCWVTNVVIGCPAPNGYSLPYTTATTNENAKFKDGEYKIHIVMADLIHEVDDESTTVIVDNFLHINNEVKIRTNFDKGEDEYYYAQEWIYNENINNLRCVGFSNSIPQENLTIEISTSEPTNRLEYRIGTSGSFADATKDDDMNYHININGASLTTGEHTLYLKSYDLNNAENYRFTNTEATYPPAYRIGNQPEDWSVPNCQGTDECHKFTITDQSGQYIANFSYDVSGNTVYFSDTSTPANEVQSWEWTFPGGSSTEQNPEQYFENGTHIIELTTFFTNGEEASVTKEVYVNEDGSLEANFTWEQTNPDIYEVTFDCLNTNLAYIEWDFGDGNYATNVYEPAHYYSSEGIYEVTLFVRDMQYNESEITQYIAVGDAQNELYVTCGSYPSGGNPMQVTYYATVHNYTEPFWFAFDVNNDDDWEKTISVHNNYLEYTHTFQYEGTYTAKIEARYKNTISGFCYVNNVSAWDPNITVLDVQINNCPDSTMANEPFDFEANILNGATPHGWSVYCYLHGDEVFHYHDKLDPFDYDFEFTHVFESEGIHNLEIFVYDIYGRIYSENRNIKVKPYENYKVAHIYTIPDRSYPILLRKGTSRRIECFAFSSGLCKFDLIKMYRKKGNLPYARIYRKKLPSPVKYWEDLTYHFFKFSDEAHYKLKVKVKNTDNQFGCKWERENDVLSIDCDKKITDYTDALKWYNNYYVGEFEISEKISDNETVHLKACDQIVLLPGFETGDNVFFTAEIVTVRGNSKQGKSTPKTEIVQEFIKVIPNPNTGIFAIDLFFLDAHVTKIEIINELGTIVYQNNKIENSTFNVNISNYAPGLYFAKVYTDNKIYFQKIIYQ